MNTTSHLMVLPKKKILSMKYPLRALLVMKRKIVTSVVIKIMKMGNKEKIMMIVLRNANKITLLMIREKQKKKKKKKIKMMIVIMMIMVVQTVNFQMKYSTK